VFPDAPISRDKVARSDWSKEWLNPELATRTQFPGVKLDALRFLHFERKILFHGHEALDTDTTPTLEGEAWLLRNGYTQREGVANLDKVPEKGALVAIGDFQSRKGEPVDTHVTSRSVRPTGNAV
jgi:kynurenine formamidase